MYPRERNIYDWLTPWLKDCNPWTINESTSWKALPLQPNFSLSLPLSLSLHDISRSFSTVFGRNGVSWRKKVALLENAYAKKEGGREKKCEREKNRASTTSRANEFITIGSWSSTRVYTHACPPVRGEPIDNQGANQMITSRQNACWLSTTAGIIEQRGKKKRLVYAGLIGSVEFQRR